MIITTILKKWLFGVELFSPKGFLVRAVLLALLFAICHIAGLREHTTFISGTTATVEMGVKASALYGMIYIAAYFGFVLGSPILAVAAALLVGWERLRRKERVVGIAHNEKF